MSSEQNVAQVLPTRLVGRQQKARRIAARRLIGPAVECPGQAAGLAMDDNARRVVPGHHLGEQRIVHLATGQPQVFGAGAVQRPDRPEPCPPDVTGDEVVDVLDLLEVLSAWGPCL